MANLLIDNWTLQETADILNYGLNTRRSNIFSAPDLTPTQVPLAAIQIDSLFSMLLDLVLRDKLLVDNKWITAWEGSSYSLDVIHRKGLIEAREFNKDDVFFDSRDFILKSLNLSEEIVSKHYENVEYWSKHGTNKYEALSTVVSGTIGYLARSNILSTVYSPHPIRATFLESTSLYQKEFNAHDATFKFIGNERLNLIRKLYGDEEYIVSKLILSPIILEIIASSNSVVDLLQTALQIREHYKSFREYLSSFQQAIDEADLKKIQDYKRMLDDVSLINKEERKYGNTELSLGFGLFKLSKINIPSMVSLRNRFGIRSVIKDLIFKKGSEGTLDKFFGFFDERNIVFINEVKDYFKLEK